MLPTPTPLSRHTKRDSLSCFHRFLTHTTERPPWEPRTIALAPSPPHRPRARTARTSGATAGGVDPPPTMSPRVPTCVAPDASLASPASAAPFKCRARVAPASRDPPAAHASSSTPCRCRASSLQAEAEQNAEQNRCWATGKQKAICWGHLFRNKRRTEHHSVRRRCWSVSWVGYSNARNWLV